MSDVPGVVYLIHFARPYKHARHYLGYTEDLPKRLSLHKRGLGARLMEVVRNAGIDWVVARTWPAWWIGGPSRIARATCGRWGTGPARGRSCAPVPRSIARTCGRTKPSIRPAREWAARAEQIDTGGTYEQLFQQELAGSVGGHVETYRRARGLLGLAEVQHRQAVEYRRAKGHEHEELRHPQPQPRECAAAAAGDVSDTCETCLHYSECDRTCELSCEHVEVSDTCEWQFDGEWPKENDAEAASC